MMMMFVRLIQYINGENSLGEYGMVGVYLEHRHWALKFELYGAFY